MRWAGGTPRGVRAQRREQVHSAWSGWGHSSEEAAKLPSLTFTIQLIPTSIRGLSSNHARPRTSHLQAFASLPFSAGTSPLTPTTLPDAPLQFPLTLQGLGLLQAEPLPVASMLAEPIALLAFLVSCGFLMRRNYPSALCSV